ncbi:TrmH family RNA methyltransferase [Pelagibius sp.]|uniref:TrmH family RNA methyltransferase n=1 Tax=Pelagibius sp. TaxID=1931238 RepID=UPI003BAF07ED
MTKRKTKLSGHRPGKAAQKSGPGSPESPGRRRRDSSQSARDGRHSGGRGGGLWLYGVHPVLAALANPRRRIDRLLLSPEAAQTWGQRLRQERDPRHERLSPETLDRRGIEAFLPEGAVHQGLAARAAPLEQPAIEDIAIAPLAAPKAEPEGAAGTEMEAGAPPARRVILLLDQVTDPHNVGAVLRSAAAFGAQAVVALDKGAPEESGTLAKSASGALEVVPYIKVTNLARTLDSLKEAGYWCWGLAGEAGQSLAGSRPAEAVALVLGAEGSGLRRLTRERCDLLVKLPTRAPIQALNISNAAAVALYELLGRD